MFFWKLRKMTMLVRTAHTLLITVFVTESAACPMYGFPVEDKNAFAVFSSTITAWYPAKARLRQV